MNSNYARALIPLILAGTFLLDVFMPWGYAVWVVGDVFGAFLTLWIEWPIAPYLVAAVGTVLAYMGHTLSPPVIPVDIAGFNRVVGIGLLWIMAWLVVRGRKAKLDDATRRLGAIVESSSDAILSVTPDGFVTSWNAGAERIFGYTANEMIGRSILTIIPAHLYRDRAWELATVRGMYDIQAYDAVRLTKDGRCIDVSVTLSPLKDAVGQFVGVSKVIRDISERKRGETLLQQAHEALEIKVQERTAELSAANHSLRILSKRLMQVQEEERSRLARDLHDEVGQLLTALKIDLQDIQHGEVGEARFDSLTDSLELVDRLLTQVRSLALDLRPSLLDDLGLVPALRWYVNRQAERNGWILSLSLERIERIPTPIEVGCFRVVQEALTNIAKYAKAKTVDLTLCRQDQDITLIIRDDGVGFDVMLAKQRALGGESIGLLGLEERVRLAGGSFIISSVPGEGTRLELCFPLTEHEQTKPHATVEVASP
ncbi:PAS domain-containing sensor histidine kinase [Candidatus Nitrospira nitrificans]|uniref:histidine kinase n=1 Tax=Candidatus Nitrospira nitrificans TaxID=1742973 RepID=A0A0S4LLB9_9BACT|nr:PAS domain S-box protein [Candidatus Nitrospira nitrificans]CUS36731.1 putative Sonsor histidine kinase [Candidatus Nitrospira nitrificans]